MAVTQAIGWIFYGAAVVLILSSMDHWRNIVSFSGIPSLKTIRRMFDIYALRATRIKAANRQVHIREVALTWSIMGVLFGLVWLVTRSEVFLSMTCFSVVHIISAAARHGIPPGILLLGSTGELTERLHLSLRKAGSYPSVISLLAGHSKLSEIKTFKDAELDFGSLRTEKENVWEQVVEGLINIAPIVVIDTRKVSSAVSYEIALVSEKVPVDKFFFVTEVNSQRKGVVPDFPWEKIEARFPKSSITTEEELLAWIEKAARNRKALRQRFHFN